MPGLHGSAIGIPPTPRRTFQALVGRRHPIPAQAAKAHHETHLSSIESSSRPHPRLSRPHEITRWPGGHQRPACQRQEAPGRLTAASDDRMPQRPPPGGPLSRLVESAEFERVLRARSRATTLHFAVHHSAALAEPIATLPPSELSTTPWVTGARPVDDFASGGAQGPRHWLGAVVPKRHARRAVTRSLLKRQIYAAAERHRANLAQGIWVVRLRAPFDRTQFPSAASTALTLCARGELEALFQIATATAPPSAESR